MTLFVSINAMLIGYSLNFDLSKVINGGDTQTLLNPALFNEKSLFVWEDTDTGIALFVTAQWLPYSSFMSVANYIFNNINLSSFVFYVALFSLSGISMFLLSEQILRKTNALKGLGISIFSGLFYSLNLYTTIEFHTPVSHILYLFGITPLLILLFIKFEASNDFTQKLKWLLAYGFLYLPLTRVINMFVVYLLLIPLIGFLLHYGVRIPVKSFLKSCIIVSVVVCVAASPILGILVLTRDMPVTDIYSKSAAKLELTNRVLDSIRLIRTFALACPANESLHGVLSYSFLPQYKDNPLLIFITFYPILAVTFLMLYYLPKLQKQDKSRITGLLLIATLSIILTTPSLTPLGEMLYQDQIYIFRAAWKYFSIPYILCLSTLMVILLKQSIQSLRRKMFAILLISLVVVHLAYISPAILIYGKPVNQAWIVKIPTEYYDLAEFLHEDHANFRILPVPITKHFAGYVPYKWGYVGPDVLYTLTDKPILDKHHNPIAPPEFLDLMDQIEASIPEELLDLLKTTNVKYILLRDDVDTNNSFIKFNHPPEYYRDFLENSDAIRVKYTFGNLTLYELKNYVSELFMQPVETEQTSTNPQEIFNNTVYTAQNVTYLWFDETPISMQSNANDMHSFSLHIRFKLLYKNTTSEEWQALNNGLIQTELFKISVSPKGWLYFFVYFRNGSFFSLTTPFQRMERISSIDMTLKNNTLTMYLDSVRVGQNMIDATELINKLTKIKIGTNFGNNELLVGNIYDIHFTVNDEEKINTKEMFLSYTDHLRREEINELRFSSTNVEWQESAPTYYVIRLNTTQTANGNFLVFLTTYDPNWKAYVIENESRRQIPDVQHLKVFNYANAWFINQTGIVEIIVEYEFQRWFFYGSIVSATTFLAGATYLTYSYTRNKNILKRIKTTLKRNKPKTEPETSKVTQTLEPKVKN